MEVDEHIAALDREGQLLLAAVEGSDLGAGVPACPAWSLRDLVAHVGEVHRWATGNLAGTGAGWDGEPGDEPAAPSGEALVPWFRDGLANLIETLRSAPADLACWTFLPAPSPLAMWARRQAHETAVHRVDAEQAAGSRLTAFDPRFAADGVDELLYAFLGRRRPAPGGALRGRIGLKASDIDERWTARVFEDSIAVEPVLDDGDVVVTATAGDLYLLLWHRRAPEDVDVDPTPARFESLWRPFAI